MRKFLKFFNIFAIFWQILPFYMYNIKQMEDERMRKSKLIAVFTAATMAMTMAAPSALPGDGFGVITKADEKKELSKLSQKEDAVIMQIIIITRKRKQSLSAEQVICGMIRDLQKQ